MVHRPGSAPPGGVSSKLSRLPTPLGLSQRPRRAFGAGAAPPGEAFRHKLGDKSRIAVSPMILCNNKRNNGGASCDLSSSLKRGILPPPSPEIPNGFSSGSQLTAALLARAAQKLSSASSAVSRRKRTGSRLPVTMSTSCQEPSSDNDPQLLFSQTPSHLATNFHEILRNNPPLTPPSLLRNLGHKETSASGRVKVMLRVCRGPGQEHGGNHLEVDLRKKQVTMYDPAQEHGEESRGGVGVAAPKMFAFDAIFGPDDPQSEVCSGSLNEVLQAVVNGNDACLFSYGYSGLGKSRTMVGNTEDGVGVIPAAISWLYKLINEQKQRSGARFSVRVSALQIAGKAENLHDLLADYANGTESSGTSPGMYLREDPLFGAQLLNQSELRAPSAEKAAYYLDAALTSKQTSEDTDNVSHFLFTLHVYQYRIDKSGRSGVAGGRSRLHLLDLGGCDRQMQVFGQSKSFRLSLAGLGNVILAIFNGQKHIPYKETKLTRLLRDVLGNVTCRAAMIAHVSTSPSRYTETLATVQLASRIHRLRHKKSKHGAGGGEDGHQRGSRRSEGAPRSSSSELCTSSSEQSCDTVIFVGGTNGLDVSDEGCKVRGAAPMQPVGRPSFANVCKMAVAPSLPTIPSDSPWTSTREILSPRRHPPPTAKISPNEVSRIPIKVMVSSQPNRRPMDHEQWVDGPTGGRNQGHQTQRSRVHGSLEMWVDGPQAEVRFLDCGKRAMIQEWIEMQTRLLEVTSIRDHPPVAVTEEDTKAVAVKDSWIQVTEDEIMAECVALGGLGSLERLPMTMECEEVVEDDDDDDDEMVDKDHPLRVLSEESLPASFTTVGTDYGSTRNRFLFRRASSRSLQHLNVVEVVTQQQEVVTRSLSETSVVALPLVAVSKNAFLEELRKPDGASDSNLERHPSAPEVTFMGGGNPWFKMGQLGQMGQMGHREEQSRPDGVATSKLTIEDDRCMNILDRFKLDAVSMDDLATSGECAYESWAWPSSPSRQVTRLTPQRKDRKSTATAFCCVGAATGTGSGSLRSSSCGSSLEFITAKDYEAAKANAKIMADDRFAGKQTTVRSESLSNESPCAGREEQKSNVAKKEMNGQHAEVQFSGGSSGYESMARGDYSSSISHPESTNESSTEETLKANTDSALVTNENIIEERQDVEDMLDSFEIDVYNNEDLARFERRTSEEIIALRRERSRYFRLKQKQTELKHELSLAKSRLMIDESRWSYDLFVEDSMEQSDPSFLEALENETLTLEKRVVACRSRVWMETSFDAIPIKDVEAR